MNKEDAKPLGKTKQCKKCKVITEKYNHFKHVWSNGSFELNDKTISLQNLVLCYSCTNQLGEWLFGK